MLRVGLAPDGVTHTNKTLQETLNARSEYTNEDLDGRSQLHLNQYVIKDEIGRGSYGAVHLATDQFGNEYVRPVPARDSLGR
jgi:[calcium/calmodulin-dependent protein kinase] kinase